MPSRPRTPTPGPRTGARDTNHQDATTQGLPSPSRLHRLGSRFASAVGASSSSSPPNGHRRGSGNHHPAKHETTANYATPPLSPSIFRHPGAGPRSPGVSKRVTFTEPRDRERHHGDGKSTTTGEAEGRHDHQQSSAVVEDQRTRDKGGYSPKYPEAGDYTGYWATRHGHGEK